MKTARNSNLSRIRLCLDTVSGFGLSEEEGRVIVENQVRIISDHFDPLCEEAGMTESMRERMRRRVVLNSGCLGRVRGIESGGMVGQVKAAGEVDWGFVASSLIEPSSDGS